MAEPAKPGKEVGYQVNQVRSQVTRANQVKPKNTQLSAQVGYVFKRMFLKE